MKICKCARENKQLQASVRARKSREREILIESTRLKSLLGIARQWSSEKFAILTLKPRSHVRILIHRTWAIVYVLLIMFFTCRIFSFSLWYPHDDRWPKRMEHGCLMEVLWKLTLCMPT